MQLNEYTVTRGEVAIQATSIRDTTTSCVDSAVNF